MLESLVKYYVINKNILAELMRVSEKLKPDAKKKIIPKQTYDKLKLFLFLIS